MSMSANQVVEAWKAGRAAANATGSFLTNGDTIHSYQLCIGFTDAQGRKIALYARAPHNFYSQTTSGHSGRACRVADMTITSEAEFKRLRTEAQANKRGE